MRAKLFKHKDFNYQRGWVYNEGPPHDHNLQWNGMFLEEYNGNLVMLIREEHYNVLLLVDENDEPILYEDKIIMDLYRLIPKDNIIK